MARKKNSSFQGATVFDTDVDAPSFQRVVENTVGDVALIFDKVTGSNGETSTIIHTGASDRGARLGVPIVNQFIGKSINLTNPVFSKATNGGLGETWLLWPVFLVPGE